MRKYSHRSTGHSTNEPIFLGFSGLYAHVGDHIGHFYRTRDEMEGLLIPFLKTGLEAGDKCVYLMSPELRRRDIHEALAAAQIKVEDALASGQLVLDEGRAIPEELQEWFTRVSAKIPESFRLLRWGGDMTWALKKVPTSNMLMEWETMCNMANCPPAVFLYQYDLSQFLGSVVIDALKTHPLCVVSNVIHRNPLYCEPAAFLEELHHRQATQKAS